MIEFKEGMTAGQIVDALADDYFSQGADAFTANYLALRDVLFSLNCAVDLVSDFLERLATRPEVSE